MKARKVEIGRIQETSDNCRIAVYLNMSISMNKSTIFIWVVAAISLLLMGCSHGQKQQGTVSHTNELECMKFIDMQPIDKVLYFRGQSMWKSNTNQAKMQALQQAKGALATSLFSFISTSCTEFSTYKAGNEESSGRMEHACRTVITTKNLNVSSLSKDVAYCIEEKEFYQSSKRRSIYRVSARITLLEDSFDQYMKSLSSD